MSSMVPIQVPNSIFTRMNTGEIQGPKYNIEQLIGPKAIKEQIAYNKEEEQFAYSKVS